MGGTQMSNTNTPLTDEAEVTLEGHKVVLSSFARNLEQENIRLTKALHNANQSVGSYQSQIEALELKISTLKNKTNYIGNW